MYFNKGNLKLLILGLISFLLSCGKNIVDTDKETSFDALQAEFIRAYNSGFDSERNVPVEKVFEFKICLIDMAFNQPLSQGYSFALEHFNKKYTLKTMSDGCIYWSVILKLNYFEKSKYLESMLKIGAIDGHLGELAITTSLNPWNNDQNTFFDYRFFKPSILIQDDDNRITEDNDKQRYNAYLTVKKPIRMNFIRRSFSLEEDLNLKIHRQYQINIEPEVISYDEVEGYKYLPHEFHREKFKLKLFWIPDVVVQSGDLSLATIGSIYENIVEVEDGFISDDKISFSLSFASLPLLEYKTWLYIYLEPLDASLGIKPAFLKIMFFPKSEALSEIPYKAHNRFLQDFSRLNWSTLNIGSEHLKSDYLKLSSIQIKNEKSLTNSFNAVEIDELMEKPSIKLLAKLCDFIELKDKWEIRTCRNYPQKYIDYKRINKIIKVLSFDERPISTLGQISLNATFFKESSVRELQKDGKTDYDDYFGEIAAETSLGFSFFGSGGKINGSSGWRHAHKTYSAFEISSDVNYRNRFSYFEITNLNVESLSFNFRALGHRCIALREKNEKIFKKEQVICKDEVEEREYNDSWYYITQGDLFSSKVLYDHSADGELPWRKVIRGRKRYQAFRETLGNRGELSLILVPEGPMIDPNEYLKGSYDRYKKLTPFFPDSAMPAFIEL